MNTKDTNTPAVNQSKSQAWHAPGAQIEPLVTLSFADWTAQYRPGERLPARSSESLVQDAMNQDARTVWTELKVDGRRYIVNGWCFVNREAYYITDVPASSMLDNIEVNL